MEEMTCPRCGATMETRVLREISVHQCPEGHGIFLERADLAAMIDAETNWHRDSGFHTAPLPRITADMTAPPPAPPRPPAWIATLFS